MGKVADRAVIRKVRILKYLDGVHPEYQPVVGKVYDAIYNVKYANKNPSQRVYICIIDVKDKKICLRKGEYELLGDDDG